MRQNQRMSTTAIILAAGRGRRLGDATATRPKCLLPVGPHSLLEHQLDALRSHGVEESVVVVGYCAEAVQAQVNGQAGFVVNQRHSVTNSLYSLWLARDHAQQGFLLLNADVLFDPEVLTRVLASPHENALAVERRRQFDPEEMKVTLEGDRIRALSKALPAHQAHAENLGVGKFSAQGARRLFSEMERLLAEGQAEREFCPYAFNAIAQDFPLHAVPVDDLPWIEIDFAQDLLRAREEVWPAILARRRQRLAPAAGKTQLDNPISALGN